MSLFLPFAVRYSFHARLAEYNESVLDGTNRIPVSIRNRSRSFFEGNWEQSSAYTISLITRLPLRKALSIRDLELCEYFAFGISISSRTFVSSDVIISPATLRLSYQGIFPFFLSNNPQTCQTASV